MPTRSDFYTKFLVYFLLFFWTLFKMLGFPVVSLLPPLLIVLLPPSSYPAIYSPICSYSFLFQQTRYGLLYVKSLGFLILQGVIRKRSWLKKKWVMSHVSFIGVPRRPGSQTFLDSMLETAITVSLASAHKNQRIRMLSVELYPIGFHIMFLLKLRKPCHVFILKIEICVPTLFKVGTS